MIKFLSGKCFEINCFYEGIIPFRGLQINFDGIWVSRREAFLSYALPCLELVAS